MFHAPSRLLPALVALSSIPLLVLTGCGAATSFSNPTASSLVSGKIFGGQQPITGSTVTVWQAGTLTYGSVATPLAITITGSDGTFSFPAGSYTCTAGEQVYITAAGGQAISGLDNPHIMLATGLGDCTAAQSAVVEINEVSTAVTAFALGQFFTKTLGSTDDFGTDPTDLTAFTNSNQYLIPTLIDLPSGTVQPNTAGLTIEAAKIYSIANTLAACVNDAAGFANCNTLFSDTTPPNGTTAPTDTLQAAVQMSLFPYQNVQDLYQLATKTSPFTGLSTAPNDWTVGVSYTSSNFALGISGTDLSATSASIDIDASGKVWFASNLSGATGVAAFDPTTAGFEGPYLTGAYVQPQYVAIDINGYVWMTDNGSAIIGYTDTTDPDGVNTNAMTFGNGGSSGPLGSDAMGYTDFAYIDPDNGPSLVSLTPLITDAGEFNQFASPPTGLTATFDYVVTMESGSSTLCKFEVLDFNEDPPSQFVSTTDTCNGGGVALASGSEPDGAEDALGMASSLNEFCFIDAAACGGPPSDFAADVNLPQGVATDGYGNEWIANSGNASIFTFGGINATPMPYNNTSPVAYIHDSNNGSTLTTPYAIAIDGSGNVWVANAGCVTTSATACTPGAFVLSEIIGAAGPTITPLSSQMVDDGALVGTPPTAPHTMSSAHPHRFDPKARSQSASTPTSRGNGKPLAVRILNR